MKELIKFTKKFYFYIENRWMGFGIWGLVTSLIIITSLTSWLSYRSRLVFLEANSREKLSLDAVITKITSQGSYQVAKQIVKREKLKGWGLSLEPRKRLEMMTREEEKVLKESPYLERALENLVRLNQALGNGVRAKYYQKLKEWVSPYSD